ncbi:MAG: hypothetical protein A3K09_07215 [Nitrospinae bacterium RIFCSPLOWO2_12_FULL_47_7]|nr:MAG: hypothetical protein A3K09_07215 [Nitrospinae bacterium RIFCSPLOWO2_12_FULL_47_7]
MIGDYLFETGTKKQKLRVEVEFALFFLSEKSLWRLIFPVRRAATIFVFGLHFWMICGVA